MATYLPNVNKYVSKSKAFTPNFKFISDALSQRQDRYDTNYRKMNNLYGSVVHADLSREDNREIRDSYAKELAPKLQQISGVDFSLQQNVDAAKALFTPFFEDDKMVRDIVFTKRHQSELQKFQNFRQSNDEETRRKYWGEGVSMLNYSMADFQAGSREASMNVQLPEAVENINLVQMGIDALKELGMSDEQVSISPDGNYQVTQKNGSLLTRRAIGKDEKTGDMIYTNPAQDYINQTVLDDPRVQRYYATKHYVRAREFYEANAEKYGGIDAAKKVFYNEVLSGYFQDHEKNKAEKEKEVISSVEAKNDWDSYRKKHGDFVLGSEEHKDYLRARDEYLMIKNGRKLEDKHHNEIDGESQSIDDLERKSRNAYMMFNIDADTKAAAKFYSNIESSRTVKADEYALKNHAHGLSMIEKEYDNAQKRINTAFEKGYMIDDNGQMIPLPWAEGGSGGGNQEGVDVGVRYNDASNTDIIAGSAEETMNITNDGTVDVVADNSTAISNKIQGIRETRWNAIETYYSDKANDLGDDDTAYTSDGMKIDGKFMSWKEAKEYYLDPENKEKFKTLFTKVENIVEGKDTGPSLQRNNPATYLKLKEQLKKIESDGVAVFVTRDKQNEVTQNVINLLLADGDITSFQANMLDAYPIFNSQGQMIPAEQIVDRMQKDFIAWYDGIGGNLQGQDLTEVARKFGFKNEEELLEQLNPRDLVFGGNARVRTSQEQKTRGKTTIQFMADKHFKNIYNEYFGKDSATDLFNDIKNKVNKRMTTANAIPGVTSFNAASMLTNQQQGGTGGTIYNYHASEYINGQFNSAANDQLRLINQLLKGPKQNYSITKGDASGEYTAVTDPEALATVTEFIKNTKMAPGDFPKGKGPNATIAWAEVIGGENGKGNHSGWVITFGDAYANEKETTDGPIYDITQNQITIFADKEFGQNNPNAVRNTYVSETEFIVDLDNTRVVKNDGGKFMFYRNSDDQMMFKYALAVYDKNTKGGSIVYSGYSDPQPISGGFAIDQVYNHYDNLLEKQIQINTDASNAHKKETKSSNSEQ